MLLSQSCSENPLHTGKGNRGKLLHSAARQASPGPAQCWKGTGAMLGWKDARLPRCCAPARLRTATAHPAAPRTHGGSGEKAPCLQDCASATSLPCNQRHPTAPRLPGRLPPAPAAARPGCTRLLLPRPGPAPSAAKRAAKPLIRPSATSGTAEPRPPRCPAATRVAPAARWTQRWHSGASSRLQLRARQNAAALPRGRQQGLARCSAGTGRKARETRIYRQQNEQRS